ncbi:MULTISPECIES: SDR family NAD(P)-dependent oxidoreductase [unclassified Streptomyces]|jgi:NAD(P)-dependent dehydrogenase (short-subunit alcohol dehydrogenase family)|uniref:SDR family NAD(P)-dependent oxidoreductase n=1 Tax=unclassified Streptomyces TaxID=2593676 RepID=UPI0022551C1F|nr:MULTISPECIES: SDR family oxidoreductase [unclassified Streptomyces]MCX4403659.1 SDR family oxidoreductase [Streptomyces sp. NBC_01764]MCX5181388.1 SDR family oxidoreductase [Streptomyces sp. NBC_00268]
MTLALEGKVAVVTGGASGVGLGIAQEFVDQGATVVITDLQQDQIDAAVAVIGPKASGVVADVSKLADMKAVYAEVIALHGRLDAVVANAGIGAHAPLEAITEDEFDRTFNINVKGVLFTVQPAIPLLPSGGTIVVIGSTASIQPPRGMSLYAGAKAAVRNCVRVWIQDVKGSGIRINVLSPGAVDTESLRRALAMAQGADKVDAAVKAMGEGNPTGRIAEPREMGKAAAFLSSDASSFVTGVELFADGGMAQV